MIRPNPTFRNAGKFLVLFGLSVILLSCETIGYYTQAARGQMSILTNRQAIHSLLQDEALDATLRGKLQAVLAIREFARSELGLPVADNYSTYVELDRDYVVWNVFAAPEFSTDPVNWCFPIAGCVSYRGYFSEEAATGYAQRLEREGFDVYTGGVDAYSTLGWFDDSLLSTVIKRSEQQLAALIFHELAHQVVYVPGDTTFNESFATAVEREGLRRWLAAKEGQTQLDEEGRSAQRQREFVDLVIRFRDRFDAHYASTQDEATLRAGKQALQQELRLAYGRLKESWGGYGGYDRWFSRPLNNAQLSTVASYNDLTPQFTSLLESEGGSFGDFFHRVAALAELDFDARREALSAYCTMNELTGCAVARGYTDNPGGEEHALP